MESQTTRTLSEQEKYAQISNHSKVKKVIGEVPFAKNLSLIDLSIKGRAREDEHFARDPFLRANIRRGVSYMKEEGSGAVVSRRGLQKFFDMRVEYLSMLEGETYTNLSKTDQKLFKVIFDENEQVLKKGGKITVYKTEKANGENAQVSYNPKYDAWVVASKNVSIMIRNEKDIKEYEQYSENRYSFATLIATTWLDILKRHVKDVEALKKDMIGKTFIGEYCGNPQYQHLVEYSHITILFYAAVEYHSDRTCLPVEVAQNLFQKHSIPMVRMTPRKVCSNHQDLTDILRILSREVSQNPIEEDQEGSVLYFEAKLENETFITSLCKLKTLEYRLYRKLREKLKTMMARGNTVSDQMDRYKSESEELCKVYKPPKPMDFYFDVARIAFTYVYANRDFARSLGIGSRYLDFLKVILKCKQDNVKPTSAHFQKLAELAQQYSDESDPGAEKEEAEDDQAETKKKDTKKNKKSSNKGSRNKISDDDNEEVKVPKKKSGDIQQKDEETKLNEYKPVSKKRSKDLPKRIVIIAPPFYFDFDLLNKIKERSGVDVIQDEFKENDEIHGNKNLAILCKFPRISSPEAIKSLEKNTLFIIAGFEPENQKSTVKKLEGVAENKEKFQSNGFLFMYINSKDKPKSVEGLWAQYEAFKTKIHEILPNNYSLVHLSKADKILDEIDMGFQKLGNIQANLEVDDHVESIETQSKKIAEAQSEIAKKNHKGQILVFVPIGIPGMGKTTFLNLLKKLLEEKGCAITIISSDDIRKVHTDEILQRNPKMTRQVAFEKAAKASKKQFFEDLENAIKKSNTLVQGTHVIFLDKNHPPSIIQTTIQEFQKAEYRPKYRIRVVILKPQCARPLKFSSRSYPFSLNFFLTCVQRAIAREDHPTLMGSDVERAGVLFSFFNLYKNFEIDEYYLKCVGANFLMELPFTHEDPDFEESLPATLVQSTKDVMKGTRGFEQDPEKLAAFLNELDKANIQLKNPDQDQLYQQCVKSLNTCFNLFNLDAKDVAPKESSE